MADIRKINDESLENVVGGRRRVVNNPSVGYANLRATPNGEVLGQVYNGEIVNTTGASKYAGDYHWFEVEYDGDFYWIAGHLIGIDG